MPIVSIQEFKVAAFDYLIVGGGTAGLTLTARLSEDPNVVVGVVEAGGHYQHVPEIDTPAFVGRTIANPIYDWTFLSVPQTRANNRIVLQPRGKGLGGSSLINFLGMIRPSKEELDTLERLGNKGWNWESLLAYMKKSETAGFSSDLSTVDAIKCAANPNESLHGTSGPIMKTFPTGLQEQQARLFDAAEALGVPRNGETSGGSIVGSMTTLNTVDALTATRCSAMTAHFEPNKSRKNLLVLVNARATKVLFEKVSRDLKRAVGLEVMCEGKLAVFTGVKRDVILSAGSFQTPQLLELSGIGNGTILKKYGIDQLIHLPTVGENLQDHISVLSVVEIDTKFKTLDDIAQPEQLEKQQKIYAEKQKGLLASAPTPATIFISPKHIGGIEQSIVSEQLAISKDAEAGEQTSSIESGRRRQLGLQRAFLSDDSLAVGEILNLNGPPPFPGFNPLHGKKYNMFASVLMRPESRGTVHIASPSPLDPPAIDVSYFSRTADLDVLVRIVQFTHKLFKTPPYNDVVREVIMPAQELVDNEEMLSEWIRANCMPVFHPEGTASMLPEVDGGVVDSELKVYGTANLRVVDASILPMEVSGHIQSVVYAVAEKAADILKAHYGQQSKKP